MEENVKEINKEKDRETLAKTSLLISIFTLIPVLSLFLFIPAFITSIMGLKSKNKKGYATAALIITIIGFIITVLIPIGVAIYIDMNTEDIDNIDKNEIICYKEV